MNEPRSFLSRRRYAMLAPLAALVIVGIASSSANAALTIRIQMTDTTNGGPSYDSGNQAGTPVFGQRVFASGFQAVGEFQASADVRAREGADASNLSTTTIDISSPNAPSTSTIEILVSVTGYSLPGQAGSFLQLSSSASGTSDRSSNNQSAVLASFGDPSNTQFGMAESPGPQTGVIVIGSTTETRSYVFGGPDPALTFFNRESGEFSLTQRFLITLDPDRQASLTLGTTVVSVVPEPSSLAMLLGGVPLALMGIRRLRRSQGQP